MGNTEFEKKLQSCIDTEESAFVAARANGYGAEMFNHAANIRMLQDLKDMYAKQRSEEKPTQVTVEKIVEKPIVVTKEVKVPVETIKYVKAPMGVKADAKTSIITFAALYLFAKAAANPGKK